MKNEKRLSITTGLLRCSAFALVGFLLPLCQAATIWNGPNTNFSHAAFTSTADIVFAGKVALTRGANEVLYNTAATPPDTSGGANTPTDTTWAFTNGSTNFLSLTYMSMKAMHDSLSVNPTHNMQAVLQNKAMVVHLINEDIYIPIMFTEWGHGDGGSFAYTRATAPTAVAPTVTLTNPIAGSVFVSPASISLGANASVSGGTVTNVQYFANTATSLGSSTTAPFNVTGSIPAPGSYSLTAVATAGGLSTTSAPVNITVVARPTATITNPANGSVFAAPANVKLGVNAAVSGGTVTNVSYFNGATLLGSSQVSPFNVTASNLSAGAYTLTAIATASGVSGTSSVVNVSIVNPVATSLSAAARSNNTFSFNYAANPGLIYVVEKSTNLSVWTPVLTNVAAANPASYSEGFTTNPASYFRVGRLPNP